MPLTAGDLVVRTLSPDNRSTANTFATLAEIDDTVKFRMDAAAWDALDTDLRVRAIVSAYRDLCRLTWMTNTARSQSRDYEFDSLSGVGYEGYNRPPLEFTDFQQAVREAQAAQVMAIVHGTQVRDMAREGIRMTRALTGSEMEFTGYRGPVCGEAREILARWVDQPRMGRMR